MTATVAVDPDLEALPRPRRPWRRLTLALMSVAAVASLLLLVDLLPLCRYALRSGRPTDIGALTDVQLGPQYDNRWVRARGDLAPRGAAYRRPLDSDQYRLAPIQGRPDVWIELRIPGSIETEHYIPPVSFVGRLVPFAEVGVRYASLEQAMGVVSPRARRDVWVLLDGQSPAMTRWALGVAALALGFLLFNAWGLAHLLRPVSR